MGFALDGLGRSPWSWTDDEVQSFDVQPVDPCRSAPRVDSLAQGQGLRRCSHMWTQQEDTQEEDLKRCLFARNPEPFWLLHESARRHRPSNSHRSSKRISPSSQRERLGSGLWETIDLNPLGPCKWTTSQWISQYSVVTDSK